METISSIREIEASIVRDPKNTNSILEIKKHLKSENKNIQTACIHSLRRIFVHICDSSQLTLPKHQSTKHSEAVEKFQQFKKWVLQQLQSYLAFLFRVISSGDDSMKPLAIRTVLEFVKREHITLEAGQSSFGVETMAKLIQNLLAAPEIDIDILVMLKDEVFSYPDVAFFGYVIMSKILTAKKVELKSSSSSAASAASGSFESTAFVQNALDLLRVMPFPSVDFNNTEEVKASFLVPDAADPRDVEDDNDDEDGGGDSDDSDDADNDADMVTDKVKRKRERAAAKHSAFGAGGANGDGKSKRKRQKLSRVQQLVDKQSYRRVFSKAWTSLMSLPAHVVTTAQHKLILKHLPEHVMPHLLKPLLLADYLSSSFSEGGVVAVLALDSLFQLIVMHNLDYPKYFVALYKLCNLTVFSASYRAKFMRLLSKSLTSTNLPHYLVAAFAKRLGRLSLEVPTPVCLYCVAQITKLIRDHPQLLQLIHRTPKVGEQEQQDEQVPDFDNTEEEDLERAHATTSSLWELTVLKQHYLCSVNSLVTALETQPSTTQHTSTSEILVMEDFITPTYASLLETEIQGGPQTKKGAVPPQKNTAMDYIKPTKFFGDDSVTTSCFGGL